MQAAINQLLVIDDIVGSSNEVRRGAELKRTIRIKNLGDKPVDVDVWVEPRDKPSEFIQRCRFSIQNPLRIEPHSSQEITLTIEVPPGITPGTYNYEILLEAAAQYPGKVVQRPQQLKVLASEYDAEWGNEPVFTIISPITNSINPAPLQASEQLEVKVRVENRSKRVDRFYLICPKLDKESYSVRYPEVGWDVPGLVKETDGLELNPGGIGEIILILHPPEHTLASDYCPDVQLISSNHDNLMLLDVVYIQILPNDQLSIEMRPQSRRIPREIGQFEIELVNKGNIEREIAIRARDYEEVFVYNFEDDIIRLAPGEIRNVPLKVKPKKWWRRHWRSKGLPLTFDVEIENIINATSDAYVPALPKTAPQGKLLWEPYPWWMFWMLLLLGLGTVGILAFVIWWNLLREKIPLPTPKVIKFETAAKSYQEGKDDAIRLNWEISHLKQIEKVTVIRLESNVETERKNYIFKDGVPSELKPGKKNLNGVCSHATTVTKESSNIGKPSFLPNWLPLSLPVNSGTDVKIDNLKCKGIITTAQKPGNYTFKIEVFSKQNSEQVVSSQITDTIAINPATPLPLPKILDLSSTVPNYEEAIPQDPTKVTSIPSNSLSAPIRLNWEISSPKHIKELRVVGKAPDGSIISPEKRYQVTNNTLPIQLAKFCQPEAKLDLEQNLICKNIPMEDARKPGDYIFTLTVVPKDGKEENAVTKQTATIKIQPLPEPKITNFSPAKPSYQEESTSPVLNKAQDKQNNTNSLPIRLNWEIASPTQIQEMQVVSLDGEGIVRAPLQRHLMVNNQLPDGLKKFCTLTDKILVCRNVPTDIRQAGKYTFKMIIIPKRAKAGDGEIIKATDAIKVEPKKATPTKIIAFKINGEDVKSKPKHSFVISKQRSEASINVSWQVEKGEDIKVELLPAPGIVDFSGSIQNYSLKLPPSNETITLKVTNSAGEQMTQSVVIETVEPSLGAFREGSGSSRSNSNNSSSGASSPAPSTSMDKQAPMEFPPLAN